jgi:hypothetical protein
MEIDIRVRRAPDDRSAASERRIFKGTGGKASHFLVPAAPFVETADVEGGFIPVEQREILRRLETRPCERVEESPFGTEADDTGNHADRLSRRAVGESNRKDKDQSAGPAGSALPDSS